MTNRLCQDPIENLFSIFRQKGGYRKNPTCRTLRYSFASVCSFGLLNCASEKSNCEEDDDVFLASSNIPIKAQIDNIKNNNSSKENWESNRQISKSETCNDSTSEEEPQNETFTTLEKCSQIYYGGYLAKKCLEKFHCEQCQNYLLKPNITLDDKDQLLILNKTFEHIEFNSYSGLKAPSENLEQFIIICLNVFKQNYGYLKSEKYLVNQLMTKANQSMPKNIVPLECAKHFEYIMKLLFVVNIYKTCKWSSKISEHNKITTFTQKPNQKLRILQHL